MRPEKLKNIADAVGGQLIPCEASDVYTSGVSVDTRLLQPGDTFIALKGKTDGHLFVEEAYKKGACSAIVERKLECDIPQIIVKDTLVSLGRFASMYRKTLCAKVIAITGSVGKTTARQMCADVLGLKFKVHSAKQNYNNLIGLPLTILSAEPDTQVLITELGINQPSEMEKLTLIASPDIAVITNVAPVHTEGLKTVRNIMSEKLKIVNGLSENGILLVNADVYELEKEARLIWKNVKTFGIHNPADYVAENLEFTEGFPSFTIRNTPLKLMLFGRAPVYSALIASAVADFFDIPLQNVVDKLSRTLPVPHRMNLIELGKIRVLDDSYNSSPIALEEALRTLVMLPGKRKIAVLGSMLELGELEEKEHRHIAELLHLWRVDWALLFGEAMAYAYEEIKKSDLFSFFWTTNYNEANEALLKTVQPGDIVLVKGSHSMDMVRFVEALIKEYGSIE